MCDAKIRPFPNDTEVVCDRDGVHVGSHHGEVLDYAFPGSKTEITWLEADRRTFRGDWRPCDLTPGCTLPGGHPRRCA